MLLSPLLADVPIGGSRGALEELEKKLGMNLTAEDNPADRAIPKL